MKTRLMALAIAVGVSPSVFGQQVTPIWVQHINGLVNVDAADKLPVVTKNVGTPYAANGIGRSQQFALGKMRQYDSTRFLLFVKENGIDEADAGLSQAQKDLAAAYPDRSLIWVSATSGKPMGIAHEFGLRPTTAAGQANNNDFWSNWDIDEGPEGQKVLYSTHKNIILRWAPKEGGGWESSPTCAWVEPTPGAQDCAGNALDESSGGDGSNSWRWRDFHVNGSGATTTFVGGGGTWRASMHTQIFKTTDGKKFYPIARFNDRDGGRKGAYSQGGLTSRLVKPGLDPAHPNLLTAYHGRFPGTGWEARPSRFVVDADSPADTLDDSYNPDGSVMLFQVNNDAWGNLPAFKWEAAGINGAALDHSKDGVEYYDGNWGGILDANAEVDYIVNYAFPSWNNQFGNIKKPGWIGVHRLDGSIASNSGYKLPFIETDIESPDAGDQVGNEFGYDGDVTVVPDTTAPANLDKSLVFWVGSGYGYGLFSVQNVAPAIAAEPQDATLTENASFTLTADITGSPNTYQWYKDGVAIDPTKTTAEGLPYYVSSVVAGVNKAILKVEKATVADSGKYKLVAVNPLGTVTTREAVVAVVNDTVPPTISKVSNGRSADASYIRLEFSEEVTPETAGEAANYKLNGAAVVGARSIGKNAAIVYTGTVAPGTEATLTVSGVKDIASGGGNAIAANTAVTIKGPTLTAGYLLWEFYPEIDGTGVDALESDTSYPGSPSRWELMTSANTDANGLSGVADRFGGRISGWLTPTETAQYRFFIGSDDSSRLYLSNTESPAGTALIASENGCCKAFLEPAGVNPDNNDSLQTSEPVSLTAGKSYYVSFVYKEGGGGDWAKLAWRKEGDTTAAASLSPIPGALFSSYRVAPVVTEPPVFANPVLAGGNVKIEWTGGGVLHESTDLVTWTAVAGNPASPYSVAVASGAPIKFYRIVR